MVQHTLAEVAKDYIYKSWDAGIGIVGTGITISFANSDGTSQIIQADWAYLVSAIPTALLMLGRLYIMINKHIREQRRADHKHKIEMKNKSNETNK